MSNLSSFSRIVVLATVVTALGAGTLPAAAQTADDALRFSSRSPISSPMTAGMGGAGVAGVGSWGDLFQNPAGLALMRNSSFSLGLAANSAQDEGVFSVGNFSGAVTNDVSKTRIGHLAWAYRFPTQQGSLVFAAGYSRVSSYDRELVYSGQNGLNSLTDYLMPVRGEFDLLEDEQGIYPEFSRTLSFIGFETYAIDLDVGAAEAGAAVPFLPAVSTGTVQQDGLVMETGGMSEISVGGAIEASPGVFFGASLNIPVGRYEYTRVHEESDIFDDNDGLGGTTDFSYLNFLEGYSSDLAGINVRAGLSARVTDQVRIGLTVETPTIYSIDEDYFTQLTTEFDNGDAFTYGDDLSEDAGNGVFSYELKTPWRFGVGVSFVSGPLSVFGDIRRVDWSQMEFDSSDYSFFDENQAIARSLEATVGGSLGASYRFGSLTGRLGFGSNPDPRKTLTGSSVNGEQMYFGAGLSYAAGRQFTIDLGWVAQRFDDQFTPYAEVDGAPVVNETVTRNLLQLGIRLGL